jgi:hypothetical protein
MTWIEDSKRGILQSGLEGLMLLIKKGKKLDKHIKTILNSVNKTLDHLNQKLDEYWKNLKEERAKQKEEAKIQSKLLKKLRAENEPKHVVDVMSYESLANCLINMMTALSQNYTDAFLVYIRKESPQLLSSFLALTSFPNERVVIAVASAFDSIIVNQANSLRNLFDTEEKIYEAFGSKLLNMYKFSFVTNEFENQLKRLTWDVYQLCPNNVKEKYAITWLSSLQRILLKMMVNLLFYSPNF